MKTLERPARLAFVSHRFQHLDGQGRVNYEVVKRALDYGHQVTIVAAHCAKELSEHRNARFVSIGGDWLPTELLRNLAFAWESAHWLRQHRADLDIVQVNGFVTWEDGDIAAAHFVHTAWAQSAYYPFRSLTPYSLYQRLFTYLNSRWEKRVFLRAKRVIAVSSQVAKELVSLGVSSERIEVIANGVDTNQFRPGSSNCASFGLPVNVPLALFVGDIRTSRKNLDTVLRALGHAPTLSLAVAGEQRGSPYPALAQSLNVGDRVFFLGKVSRMADLMRSVDLFLVPSRYEPFSLVALEAMASGLPVIISECCGAADCVGEGGQILRDPNSVEALAETINALLLDPDLCRSMARAGRERALTMDWSTMADAYLHLHDDLLHSAELSIAR